MEIIKNYLTANEIRTIGDMICDMDNYIDREFIKILSVADVCTDIKLERKEEKDGSTSLTWKEDVYNDMIANGDVFVLYDTIFNIKDIDEYVKDKRSLYNLFNNLATELKQSLDSNNIEELSQQLLNLKTEMEKQQL